ncbi:MAG: response regulator [Butyrivibrio sp.]|nr:response regulator [Butyrivibrio sp.]
MDIQFPELMLSFDTIDIVAAMAENIPGAFFIYQNTEKGEIIFVNHAVLDLYGCATLEEFKELTGYCFSGMVHPDDYVKIQSSIDFQIDRSDENLDYVEYRIIRKDGKVRYVEDFGKFAMTDDFGPIYYVFLADVTTRYKLSIAQNSFLFNIAHNLQIPIKDIDFFLKLMKENIHEADFIKEYLTKTEESMQFLNGMVGELVEVSDMNNENVRINETESNLKAEGNKLHNLVERKEFGKNQTYKFDLPDDDVYLDPVIFGRILGNLLENAVKFTPEGGHIEIIGKQIAKSESGYARYRFEISDNGIGMSEEYVDRIFEHLDEDNRNKDGSYIGAGLGISMVKRAVHTMGGSIHAESSMGEGTKVYVYIPFRLCKNDGEYEEPEDRSMPDGCKGRILVAEDQEINREIIEQILTEAGFMADIVCDGCDAVDRFKNHREGYYDMILTDIQMPVMTGYEEIYKIRVLDREDAKKIPIYALSSDNLKEDRLRAAESGATGHISKPIVASDVLAIVTATCMKQ